MSELDGDAAAPLARRGAFQNTAPQATMDFTGHFETHLTLDAQTPSTWSTLLAAAQSLGLKCTHIILHEGRHASQPMFTRHGKGTLRSQLTAAAQTAAQLEQSGLCVIRTKIEAACNNADIPKTDAQAAAMPSFHHFEHHLKLLLSNDAPLNPLITLARAHHAHLSRNAMRHRDDGNQERFITQRCFNVGLTTAHHQLAQLQEQLRQHGHTILDIEAEYVVHDSNAAIDAGWIDPEASP